MELLLVAAGVVVGLWCWGALQRWAAPPAKIPPLAPPDSDTKR